MDISYELDTWSNDLNTDFTLGNCLFGAVKLTKNPNRDKYKCSGYGLGFDSRSKFSWTDGSMRKNVIISGVHNSSSGGCSLVNWLSQTGRNLTI